MKVLKNGKVSKVSLGYEDALNYIQEQQGKRYVIDQVEYNGTGYRTEFVKRIQVAYANESEVTVSLLQLDVDVDELYLTAVTYLERAVPAMEQLSDDLYNGFSQELWKRLRDLFEGLNYIGNIVRILNTRLPYCATIDKSLQQDQYHDLIVELHDAVEKKDHTHIADLLKYEVLERLNMINSVVESILKAAM